MRLIDLDALGVGLCSRDVLPADYCAGWNGLIRLLEKAPTVDAVPVVHGRWTMSSDRPDTIICSCCDSAFDVWKADIKRHHYCPNCGARMDGAE